MYSRIGEDGVLLASETPMLYQMNQISSEIWELINGINCVKEIINIIASRYPEENRNVIEADIIELFQSFMENNLIELHEGRV